MSLQLSCLQMTYSALLAAIAAHFQRREGEILRVIKVPDTVVGDDEDVEFLEEDERLEVAWG